MKNHFFFGIIAFLLLAFSPPANTQDAIAGSCDPFAHYQGNADPFFYAPVQPISTLLPIDYLDDSGSLNYDPGATVTVGTVIDEIPYSSPTTTITLTSIGDDRHYCNSQCKGPHWIGHNSFNRPTFDISVTMQGESTATYKVEYSTGLWPREGRVFIDGAEHPAFFTSHEGALIGYDDCGQLQFLITEEYIAIFNKGSYFQDYFTKRE